MRRPVVLLVLLVLALAATGAVALAGRSAPPSPPPVRAQAAPEASPVEPATPSDPGLRTPQPSWYTPPGSTLPPTPEWRNDPNDPRNAPPQSLFSPAQEAAAHATYSAYERAGMQQIGESYDDYRKRIGSITMCEKTLGQVVRNMDGREVQLDADECVSGTIIAEPGADGRGGGHFLAMQKGGFVGSMGGDGTRRHSNLRAVGMATPSATEVVERLNAQATRAARLQQAAARP